jgi:hypothetical protein
MSLNHSPTESLVSRYSEPWLTLHCCELKGNSTAIRRIGRFHAIPLCFYAEKLTVSKLRPEIT